MDLLQVEAPESWSENKWCIRYSTRAAVIIEDKRRVESILETYS